MKKDVFGFVIYDDVQPMDIIGPWEVLSFWKNILKGSIELFLISENQPYISCSNNIVLKTHHTFQTSPQLDVLIVPGGPGRLRQVKNQNLTYFLKKQSEKAKYIISICTGMFLLQKAGILDNKSATTYWRAIPELKSFSNLHVVEKRIVKDGNIWSSGGVSSGIDLAFELIADIAGKKVAGEVQLLFEYFPRNKMFATEDLVSSLPPYDSDTIAILPQYIKESLQSSHISSDIN